MTKMADLRTTEDQDPRLETAPGLMLSFAVVSNTMLPADKVDTMLKGVRNAQQLPG
jgi:hypothetical protein